MTVEGDDYARSHALRHQTPGRLAPIMQASVVTRYGITLIAQQCSRSTTANGFAPTALVSAPRHRLSMSRGGNQRRRGSSGLVEGCAIVLDEPVPLAPRSKIAPIIRTRKAYAVRSSPRATAYDCKLFRLR